MEFALSESFLYIPPLILAGLIALYKNNILCFWDCNPIGVATKQFTGQVAVKISALLELAKSTAIALRNFPTDVATIIKNTQLMIMNTIQGILVTITYNINALVLHLRSFLAQLISSVQTYTAYLKNTTLDFFQPAVTSKYSSSYFILAGLGLLVCTGIIWYGIQKANDDLIEEPVKEVIEEPVKEVVEEPVKEVKKPVRRRTKKMD
jgi:hypothetical protein